MLSFRLLSAYLCPKNYAASTQIECFCFLQLQIPGTSVEDDEKASTTFRRLLPPGRQTVRVSPNVTSRELHRTVVARGRPRHQHLLGGGGERVPDHRAKCGSGEETVSGSARSFSRHHRHRLQKDFVGQQDLHFESVVKRQNRIVCKRSGFINGLVFRENSKKNRTKLMVV